MPDHKDYPGAGRFVPGGRASLATVARAASGCQGCDLHERATQTVFGKGAARPAAVLIGEQPGDAEDRAGEPFVGPAGKLLDRALAAAGIDRTQVYVSNVVKHFKWVAKGKRRIHEKPGSREIAACRPWLEAEIALVRPTVIVCLGATAAQALLGRQFRVSQERGRLVESSLAPYLTATVHPSSILRAPDDESRHAEMERFVADLKTVARVSRRAPAPRDT